jgi:hypothetical protein
MTSYNGRPKKAKQERKMNNMKTKIIRKILLSLGLMFILGSAITEVRGEVRIYSMGDVPRGKTGHFRITTDNPGPPMYVYFSVSGTAIAEVDYLPIVSPVYIPHCLEVCSVFIPVKTLPDPRGSSIYQAYNLVVTLKPGLGYLVGQPSSAQMMIDP